LSYTKRWYLVHLLGGGCAECGNQNFYELEIDHKYNDGDGERKYYTDIIGHYYSNSLRAKQRLQVLCRKCHDIKDTGPMVPLDKKHEEKQHKIRYFMATLKDHEGPAKRPVSEHAIIVALIRYGKFTLDESKQYIRVMLREAAIYESKPGHYNRV